MKINNLLNLKQKEKISDITRRTCNILISDDAEKNKKEKIITKEKISKESFLALYGGQENENERKDNNGSSICRPR